MKMFNKKLFFRGMSFFRKITKLYFYCFSALFIFAGVVEATDQEISISRPKLVVQFFVDQGRFNYPLDGEYPEFQGYKRHEGGGYDKFIKEGVVFDYSEYKHAATYTSQGHTTTVTGANSRYNGSPHAIYYEYGRLGHSAKFNPLDGMKQKGIDPSPVGGSGGQKHSYEVTARQKVKYISVCTDEFKVGRSSRIGLKLSHTDTDFPDSRERFASDSSFGHCIGLPGSNVLADTVAEIRYYSDGEYLNRLEFYGRNKEIIKSFGQAIDSENENYTGASQKIEGEISGASGSAGDWIHSLRFTTRHKWPGPWAQPGLIKTISDSFASQFQGGKVYAVGDWSYPIGMVSGRLGKGFWLGDAINGWGKKGVFSSSTYFYPDNDKDGKPDLPNWLVSYNYNKQNNQPVVKSVLDELTIGSSNSWNISKCDSNIAWHTRAPCWIWDTLYSRDEDDYVNFNYDDDRRSESSPKYELRDCRKTTLKYVIIK